MALIVKRPNSEIYMVPSVNYFPLTIKRAYSKYWALIFIACKGKAVGYLWPYYWNRTENTTACCMMAPIKDKMNKPHIIRVMQFSKLSMVISWYSGLRHREDGTWNLGVQTPHVCQMWWPTVSAWTQRYIFRTAGSSFLLKLCLFFIPSYIAVLPALFLIC